MAQQVQVNFEDGHHETVQLKAKHLIAAERVLNKPAGEHSLEMTFIAAWKAMRSPLKFDEWLDEVASITELDADEDGLDPTPPAPSLDESPN